MPVAQANNLQIAYETFGKPEDPAVLLIMGLGGQLVLWPDAFCQALADGGFHVIRYDNRDIGLSDKLDHLGQPNLLWAGLRWTLRLPVRAPYLLADMAEDAVALLDALAIKTAHVIGASMGGMITQVLAARYPHRVRSITLIMTTTNDRRLPLPKLPVRLRLLTRPRRNDVEGLIEHALGTWRVIGSPSYATTDAELRTVLLRQFQRNIHPMGFVRQLVAILASGSNVPLLSKVRAPALIIHGEKDPLVPVAAARHLAQHLPHATLKIIPGMGHDLPRPLLPRLQYLILRHLNATDRGQQPASQPLLDQLHAVRA